MTEPRGVRVLVVDDDPNVIADYRSFLCGRSNLDRVEHAFLTGLEDDLLGRAVGHERFPDIDVTSVNRGRDAVEAVRHAVEAGDFFTAAFIDMELSRRFDGLRTAAEVRALDPEVHVVFVSDRCDIHPVDLSERIAPADRLFFLRRPFHAPEIQQLVLAFAARSQSEHGSAGRPRFNLAPRSAAAHGLPASIDGLPAGILLFDGNGCLVAASQQAAKLLPELSDVLASGASYETVQRRIARLLRHDDRGVQNRFPSGTSMHGRTARRVAADGLRELPVGGSRFLLLTEGSAPNGEACCMFLDITEAKQRDACRVQTAHMERVTQSLATLCEQLDAAVAYAEDDARNTTDAGPATRRSKSSRDPAGHSLTARLRSLIGRLEAVVQRRPMVPEPIHLDRLIGRINPALRLDTQNGVEVEVIAGAGLWTVELDTAGFEHALRELVRNALEAMPQGGRLTIETANTRLAQDLAAWPSGLVAGDYVRLSVQDTGRGMSVAMVERAVDPFFTANGWTGHLGLGLSAVYGFVSQTGGYLEIDGGEGRGACINLYFPRAWQTARATGDGGTAKSYAKGLAQSRAAPETGGTT